MVRFWFQTILFNINKAICLRLDAIENKMETVNIRTKYLEEKLEQVVSQMRLNGTSGGGGACVGVGGALATSPGPSQGAQPMVIVSQANTPTKSR